MIGFDICCVFGGSIGVSMFSFCVLVGRLLQKITGIAVTSICENSRASFEVVHFLKIICIV